MISQTLLVIRQGTGHDTPLVQPASNSKLLPGSLVRVGGQEQLTTKEKLMTKPVHETRMHIELDGDQEPIGWVTGISKDEVDTLKLAARGFPLMTTAKALPLRESPEHDSAKLGEVSKDTLVRVMDTIVTPEGIEKVCRAWHWRRRAACLPRSPHGRPLAHDPLQRHVCFPSVSNQQGRICSHPHRLGQHVAPRQGERRARRPGAHSDRADADHVRLARPHGAIAHARTRSQAGKRR